MKIIAIAAIALNRGIGKENDLPWSLPDDMKFFQRKTSGKTVIMGRKNYESIPHKFRPLPNRKNIVVTRNKAYKAPGCEVVSSLHEAISICSNETEVYIIGGGQIYSEAMSSKVLNEMYLTEIQTEIDADVFFPKFDESEWNIEILEEHPTDDRHKYAFIIKHLTLKTAV